MREELRSLDDMEMDDLWERVRIRVPGSDGFDPPPHRGRRGPTFAVVIAALVVLGLVVWALRPLGENTTTPPAATPEPVLPLQARVTATIPITSTSGAIAAGAGGVWVAAPYTRFPMDNDSVARIDPATNEVVDRTAVPQFYGDVSDVAADTGGAWVTTVRRFNDQTLGLTIFPIDPATDQLGAPIEGVGGQIVVSGNTLWGFATGTDTTPTEIVRMDAANGAILSSTPLGGTGTDIVMGDGSVFVPILTGGASVHEIVQFDAVTGALTRTISLAGVQGTYEAPVYAGDALWIPVCCTDNAVFLYKVDPATGQTIGQPIGVADGIPFGSAFGNILSMSERGRLDALDPMTEAITTLAQSGWPASHTSTVYDPSTQAVWVANATNMVTRIDIKPKETSSPPSQESSPPPTESSTPTTGDSFLQPYLAGGQGWNSRSSAWAPATGHSATTAWASTIPISQDDDQLRAAIPPTTITQLPPDGIVVTVEVVPASYKDTSVPFPYADLTFDLSKAAQRGPEAEEPPGNYTVLQMNDQDAATLVRVYFGSPNPTAALIAKAQAELDTLQLPPTCWVQGEGSYVVSASATHPAPGGEVTLSGRVPFQHEDGSYNESGTGQMVAWWNVAPDDWTKLVAGSPSPSPAVAGQNIVQLGNAPMNACTFAIPFTVPDVPPGDYPVLVLQEGGGGAALEGDVVVHVTGGP